MELENVLKAYGLKSEQCKCSLFGTGHINNTYCVENRESGGKLLLQRINQLVFKTPEAIANNMKLAADFLSQHHPTYQFIAAIPTQNGKELFYDDEGHPWRMLPFVDDSMSMDEVAEPLQAFQAAQQFAILTQKLAGLDASKLEPTIPDFHNLALRYHQFEEALQNAPNERKLTAKAEIEQCLERKALAEEYANLIQHEDIKLRMMHHDTKINNVLFDKHSGEAICPIDLDTLMPGYIFSDLGDMIRTYVSPVSEEETDIDKVTVRDGFYEALYDGYLSEMAGELTDFEKKHLSFSGKMLLYMQAIRFLADYLNGDVYYKTTYAGQNLNRTQNQLKILVELEQKEDKHKAIIDKLLAKYAISA